MKYICNNCNKEFYKKWNYDVHNNRKNKCIVNKDITNNNIIIEDHIAKIPQNAAKIPQNAAKIPQNAAIINDENKDKLTCKYCNKIYSRKDVLLRHINSYCKEKIKSDNDKKLIEQLLEQNKQIQQINNQLIEQNEKLNLLKEENEKLNTTLTSISQVSKTKNSEKINNINNSNNTNNTNNSNNTINIQNNNNFIVNFGSEDISKLTEAEILGSLKTLTSVFITFIKTVHANQRLPEFSNLQILNTRSNRGLMMEEGKFVSKTYLQIIEELINTRLPELETFAKKFKNEKKLSQREYDSISKTLEFLKNSYLETEDVDGNKVKGEKDVVKKLKQYYNDIINTLYDNRNTIIDNINICE
jgi:hypothetical protein